MFPYFYKKLHISPNIYIDEILLSIPTKTLWPGNITHPTLRLKNFQKIPVGKWVCTYRGVFAVNALKAPDFSHVITGKIIMENKLLKS